MSSADIERVLAEHRGVHVEDGHMWCSPCGELLWTATDGFEAGVLPMIGSIAETAHAHHLAAALAPLFEAAERRGAERALNAAADAMYGDERAKGEHGHPLSVASWLRDRAATYTDKEKTDE